MASKLCFLLLVSVLLALALGAPADEKEKDKLAKKTEKEVIPAKLAGAVSAAQTPADEKGVSIVDESWETFFSGSTWNIVGGAVGGLFLIGGASLAFYYFYYLNYMAYQEHNTTDAYAGGVYNNPYAYTTAGQAYPQYYQQNTGRSLESGNNWNWPQVLYMITLAQESYEKFDFQTLDCQKKALCELSQKQMSDFGETGRKVSNTFSYVSKRLLDAVEGLPMPTIIVTYLKEYREAINQGKTSNKECGSVYPKCAFSMKEIVVKYEKRAANQKF